VPAVRFDHIAIASPRIADAVPLLAGSLGGRPAFGAETPEYRFGQWEYEGGGRLEVLEPVPPDGFLARFLQARGPGIHHVTFKVPDLDAACDRARAHGYAIVGHDDSKPQWKEAFLHPRQALGIVVQLAESDPTGPPPPPWKPPVRVAGAGPPVVLVGLRMTVHALERARRQWEHVAGGRSHPEPGGGLVFRWPQSPMRIAVDVDPTRPEGPLALEYATARAVTIGAEAAKALGVVFAPVDLDRPEGAGGAP
jgi:methylmalonyl-CoA/ethylmalonyl-CoA epimerase